MDNQVEVTKTEETRLILGIFEVILIEKDKLVTEIKFHKKNKLGITECFTVKNEEFDEFFKLLALLEPKRYSPEDKSQRDEFKSLYSLQSDIGRRIRIFARRLESNQLICANEAQRNERQMERLVGHYLLPARRCNINDSRPCNYYKHKNRNHQLKNKYNYSDSTFILILSKRNTRNQSANKTAKKNRKTYKLEH